MGVKFTGQAHVTHAAGAHGKKSRPLAFGPTHPKTGVTWLSGKPAAPRNPWWVVLILLYPKKKNEKKESLIYIRYTVVVLLFYYYYIQIEIEIRCG